MAQDPLKPKDKGRVKLPRVDGAMNKLPPTEKQGGKGDPQMLEAGKPKTDKRADLLLRIVKRFKRCVEAESENRKEALDDMKFKAGEQWPKDVQAQRNTDKRPCLTINKTKTFVRQVTNDLRQNRPSINVSPVGDKGDKEVAGMYRGLIRAIERDSSADIAYDTGADQAVSSGFGYCRLLTEYEPGSFDQVIHIKRVRNQFTVYLDPDHQEPDGADARYGFITELIPRDEFKDKYPDAQEVAWTETGVGDQYKYWADQYSMRVAEYYEIDSTPRALVQLSNGHEGWEDELDDIAKAKLKKGEWKVLNRREADDNVVRWYKVTALDILDERDTVWRWIPIPKFIGDEIDIEGKVKYAGVIRDMKDPQRMYNYWRTLETEMIALQPKAPFIGAEGQFDGHEARWKMANTANLPYLEYRQVDIQGKPAPPPQRQPFQGAPQGVETAIAGAAQDMMATTGIRFDATMNERMEDESGKAIRELRRSGDLTAYHYPDNVARTLRHIGRMLVDAIPKVYDRKRMVTILREDDSEEQVQIDPTQQKPFMEAPNPRDPKKAKKLKIFNPTYGRYGVTVTIGPSFATKRIEASESMMAFAKAMPNVAALVADLIAKNQDWPGADEMARRLAKTVPAQYLTPDQKDMSPQVQALLQSMDAQIKQLHQQLGVASKALVEKDSDREVALKKIYFDFEAKLLAIVQKAEAAFNKDIGGEAAKLAESVNALMQALTPKPKEPDPMIAELSSQNKELHGRMGEMLEHMKKPKKAKLRRSDGSVLEITSE